MVRGLGLFGGDQGKCKWYWCEEFGDAGNRVEFGDAGRHANVGGAMVRCHLVTSGFCRCES